MKRITLGCRDDWRGKVEALGLTWHTHDDGTPYWNESGAYQFDMRQVESIEKAVNELQSMCIQAAESVISNRRFAEFGIPEFLWPVIEESWEQDEVSIYGRFDLAYDGVNPPKMLEYNADTPTSLIEASLCQWHWLQEVMPGKDQFNSIHERLVAAWTRARNYLPLVPMAFLSMDTEEDWNTTAYLMDTAAQAGIPTYQFGIEHVGWDDRAGVFVDLEDRPIRAAFKLYPWEFMWRDDFGVNLAVQPRPCVFLEPAWKMVLSNKALLAILWEMFPDSPYLLPSYLDGAHGMSSFVRKPILAREGANVEVHHADGWVERSATRDCYGEEGHVFQAMAPIPNMEGRHPIIGAWVVDGEAAGMGIRESSGLVTDNGSCFVPHYIADNR